ncbi:MAG: di-trans,poly-cis-decaprenylcistransferase [Cellulosilyticum sp.]|nr:di-trans,poly-cis-decaprenylcistransferase [Cellulosilyticum sp.]
MRIPKHVALIPDGNRRWAKESGLEKHQGYEHGLNPGVEALRLAKQYGIEELTYYGFTTDNCKRPAIQVQAFIDACVEAVKLIQQEDVRLLVVGNTQSSMFPKELLPYTKERVTFGKGTTKVNFLVNYGWEWDLSHMHTDSANRHTIIDSLASNAISRIDLVIRWGGRKRLSGLLPVQSVYADFYTIDEMWPDFSVDQFVRALEWYSKQDVTLGG